MASSLIDFFMSLKIKSHPKQLLTIGVIKRFEIMMKIITPRFYGF